MKTKRTVCVLLACLLPVLVSSCFLRLALSTVSVDSLGEFVRVEIDMHFDDVSSGVCLQDSFFPFRCSYGILTEDGSVEVVSQGELISNFGFFGVIIDPLIVQVPANASVSHARVSDASAVLDLVVTETQSFEAEPGVALVAEAGQKFLIFEFPTAISSTLPEVDPEFGPRFDFDVRLSWQQATAPVGSIPIKALFAGRVDAAGEVFYPPLFPCVTDMADVPVFDLPLGGPNNIIFDLLFHYFDHQQLVCTGKTFDYSNAGGGSLLCDADGDDDIDRDDIATIVAQRNTPASGPGDPLDRDANGSINVLDARLCTAECTRADCAVADPAFACGLGFEAALSVLGWAALRRRRRGSVRAEH